jgi:hypothetical protein
MATEEELLIPVMNYGKWRDLCGKVTRIAEFADGVVVHYGQNVEKSFIRWPNAVLWIPNTGTCGILS